MLSSLALILLCAFILAGLRAGVWQNGGLTVEANDIATDAATWKLHLYVNNITPATGTTLGAFTEATYTGYAAQTMGAPSVGAISGNDIPIVFPQLTFAVTATAGADQVYGYYITDSSGAVLYAAELFAGGPYNMQTNGDTLKVTVTETLTRT